MTEAAEPPTLTQFTDPMCTWCWGSEPVVRHARSAYGDQLRFRFVVGGLIEDFAAFSDAANDVSDPSDVAPHWEEAARHHGMPVDTAVFEEDPATSTYPASIAFVAARRQDRDRGHRYLRLLREAYATERRNVNRREEQVALAVEAGLDVDAFTAALDDGTARTAFQEDLARTRRAGVQSFPSYQITGPGGERRLVGYRSFDRLESALRTVAPSLEPSPPPSVPEFVAAYGPVATREVDEVCELSEGKARQVLESLADEGVLRRERRGTGHVWHTLAERDHNPAADDHTLPEDDHTLPEDDHTLPEDDHTLPEDDHNPAEGDD